MFKFVLRTVETEHAQLLFDCAHYPRRKPMATAEEMREQTAQAAITLAPELRRRILDKSPKDYPGVRAFEILPPEEPEKAGEWTAWWVRCRMPDKTCGLWALNNFMSNGEVSRLFFTWFNHICPLLNDSYACARLWLPGFRSFRPEELRDEYLSLYRNDWLEYVLSQEKLDKQTTSRRHTDGSSDDEP
jgi:hypothetical protein